ncbi:MAG: metallophosphoesterase [Coprococcus sp.]
MRIGLISDLHIDINKNYPILEMTAEAADAKEADVLVIAGDISETPEVTLSAMEQLRRLCSCPVYYVPGNHDMWNKNCPGMKTEDIYRAYREDNCCLSGKKVVLEKDGVRLALTGDIGWYDYSMASSEYTREQLERMSIGARTWQDKLFNQWTDNNELQMSVSLEKLEKQLMACGDLPVLAVTHMLPVRDFCVPESQKDWGFFNAFLGSTALEELYQHYPVRYAVCGHVHYRSQVKRNGILYICPCLGYHSEWPLYELANTNGDAGADARRHVRDALYILEEMK